MRPLSTLISELSDRTIMIRQDLPLIRKGDLVHAPHRIGDRRILPSVGRRSVASAVTTISSSKVWVLRSTAMPEQRFAQALTRGVLVLPAILVRTRQIFQCDVCCRGNPNCDQIAGPIAACQFPSTALISLDAAAGFKRDQRWGDDVADYSRRSPLPAQDVARRPSFVAGSEDLGRTGFLHQLAIRFQAIRHRANRANLTVRLGCRCRDRASMDVRVGKAYFRHAAGNFRKRLRAAVLTGSRRSPRHCKLGPAALDWWKT